MSRPPDKIRSRIKQLFGLKRETSDTSSPQSPASVIEEPVDCYELLKEMTQESGNTRSSRARILKELCEVVAAKQLEPRGVQSMWEAVKDLLNEENTADIRHVTLQFLTALVTGQYDHLKLLRAHFFSVMENQNITEDLTPRLHFLKALSLDGKDITYFEEKIGPFLLSIMPAVIFAEKLDLFLPLLRNFIRYNSSYLDEDILAGLVKQTCHICTSTDQTTELEQCLEVLDAIVRYSSLPSSALYSFLVAVCNTVNIKQFCEPSWRLMRHLLGGHLGHNAVLTMCCILEDSNNWSKCSLLRGAVFFIGMCLWGSKRVTSLMHKPVAVLPSFLKVLSCAQQTVICEVTLSMQRLVKKYGLHQHDVAWQSILEITSALQKFVEDNSSCGPVVSESFHLLLSYIEELYERHEFNGSTDKLFEIVAKCTKSRSESSVILLVSYRAQSLHPYCEKWFENIHGLMNNYFKDEERPAIRLKVLEVLGNILGKFSPLYEEEILENSVLPFLDNIAEDPHLSVRIRAVELLVDVVESSDSPKVADVLNIIEKVALSPVDPLKRQVTQISDSHNISVMQDDTSLSDIKEVVFSLVRLFKIKLFRKPSEHAERMFEILVSHINAHYNHGYRTYIAAEIRLEILKCFLSLRADGYRRLGIKNNDEKIKFSSYFICNESSSEITTLVVLPFSSAMKVILKCLQQELEWEVLDVVLTTIPQTLEDKNLILSGKQYLGSLCTVLSKMVSNYDFLKGLFRVPHEMRRPHLYTKIFPVLTQLSTYHSYIGAEEQFCLMHTMEIGLVSYSAALCVSCLTLCMLEMPSVMAKLLPTYLEKFTKLSPTPQVALPLLEFLSALSNLRHLYANFTSVQLKQVFGICLHFIDSTRYSQYTVTLAHNVISSWFTNCPLLLRKQFVSFITKSLRLTVQSHNTPLSYPSVPTSSNISLLSNDVGTSRLSAEMVEIAIDMMAKYTFSSELSQPKRTAVIDNLLANGTSRSWLLGNALVTVTVSKWSPSNLSCVHCSSESSLSKEASPRLDNINTMFTDDNKSNQTENLERPQNIYHAGSSFCSKDSTSCLCQGWAELFIRRPSGNTSWVLRLQNRPTSSDNFVGGGSRSQVELTSPEVYDSLIPKEFFDDLWAEVREEKSKEVLATTTGLLSKSADSDTLIVDLIKDHEVQNTTKTNAEDEVVDKNTERKVSFSEDGEPGNDNNIGSFVQRTRYLSHSPRDGPSAFMGLDGVKDSIDDALHEHPPEMECEDLSQSPVFEKPVVGKSPLDASPLKKFLQQDKKYLNEDSDSDSFEETLVNSDTTSNLQEDTLQNNSPLISSYSHDFDKDESTSVDVTTSSPTSCLESVLNTSNCQENESTRSFHSLPNSPTSQTSACNASQNIKRSFSPLFGFTGDKIPTRNFHVKTNKSATVDIGMLNRSSSFVDVEESVKGKRGISKLFENDNGKKQTVLLRRQTMSGSQLPKKKLNRRSYDGSFSDTVTMNHENNDEDMPMTYDAMSPNFIFLQLYHLSWFGKDHTPHAIPEQEFFHRAVKNLDRIMPYDTHKIAVIYVAEYQENDEVAILRNQYGSSRYMEFLSGLGELVRLRDCSVCDVYTGGLERNGVDGEYAYCWRSELAQVMFHIATLMPNKEKDPNCHSKKLHIGNDNVTIVYNDSKTQYKMGAIKGQFNFVEIVIKPLDNQTNIVCLNIKDELKEILMNSNLTPKIISDKNLATLVRHMALHVNMSSVIYQSQKTPTDAYCCNRLQRLRQLKRIKSRIPTAETESLIHKRETYSIVDFTKYII